MKSEDLKILLALEGKWTVSLNGREFLALSASEISVEESTIRFGKYSRRILDLDWLRPNVFRMRVRARAGRQVDTVIFYPGDQLPSTADLRRRRRAFQAEIGRALCEYFGARKIERQTLYSDRRHGIGGAYPRFLVGRHAIIAAAPDEPSAVVNGIMRAALLWAPLVRRPVVAVLPQGRHQTISARLRVMSNTRASGSNGTETVSGHWMTRTQHRKQTFRNFFSRTCHPKSRAFARSPLDSYMLCRILPGRPYPYGYEALRLRVYPGKA